MTCATCQSGLHTNFNTCFKIIAYTLPRAVNVLHDKHFPKAPILYRVNLGKSKISIKRNGSLAIASIHFLSFFCVRPEVNLRKSIAFLGEEETGRLC